jgi:hypothetical protein
MSVRYKSGNIFDIIGHRCIIVPEISEKYLEEYRYYNQMDLMVILEHNNEDMIYTMYRNYYLIFIKISSFNKLISLMDEKDIKEINIKYCDTLGKLIIKYFFGTKKIINIIVV